MIWSLLSMFFFASPILAMRCPVAPYNCRWDYSVSELPAHLKWHTPRSDAELYETGLHIGISEDDIQLSRSFLLKDNHILRVASKNNRVAVLLLSSNPEDREKSQDLLIKIAGKFAPATVEFSPIEDPRVWGLLDERLFQRLNLDRFLIIKFPKPKLTPKVPELPAPKKRRPKIWVPDVPKVRKTSCIQEGADKECCSTESSPASTISIHDAFPDRGYDDDFEEPSQSR